VRTLVLVIVFLMLGIGILSAEVSPSDVGMLFQLKNLLLSIDSFNDGYQTGIGLKVWANDSIAIRALVGLDVTATSSGTWTEIGASAGVEYHPKRSEPSPYFGGFAGTFATHNITTVFAFLLGGMTQAGGGAQLGLVIYF
jgi:hypothetical protein